MAKEFKKPIVAIGLRYDRDIKDTNKILAIRPKVTTSKRFCDAVAEDLTKAAVFCTYKLVMLPEPVTTRDAAVEAALKMDVFSRDDQRAFKKWLSTQGDDKPAKPSKPRKSKDDSDENDGDAATATSDFMDKLAAVANEKPQSEPTKATEPA